MKLKLTLILMLFIFCLSLIGCDQSNKRKVLAVPDKIMINNEGKLKELDKTNSQFKKIVELTNSRFGNNLSRALDIIDDTIMENSIYKDGLGIEFIYNNEQALSIGGNGASAIKYYKLYFQLTSKKYGGSQGSTVYAFQYGDKEHYKDSSRGTIGGPEELVTLVKNLKY